MNDLFRPVIFSPKNCCPDCGGEIILHRIDDTSIILDVEGKPKKFKSDTNFVFICNNCYRDFELNRDFIRLEDGSFKYVTEAEKIYQINRIKNLPEQTHLHVEKNPFINIEEENE